MSNACLEGSDVKLECCAGAGCGCIALQDIIGLTHVTLATNVQAELSNNMQG